MMGANPSPVPGLAEVGRITAVSDPVIRNLQITECYFELSSVLAGRIGPQANWCTFATWASKQAGQTIRKEDLRRLVKAALSRPEAAQPVEDLADLSSSIGAEKAARLQNAALNPAHFSSAIDLASDAVGRGNKKVFEEIGLEFARFFLCCLQDENPEQAKIASFSEGLRRGDPPDGQEYLRRAFGHYYHAFFEQDAKARAELILLANIEIGFHEQTRLQPEIAESLDSGLISSVEFTRRLLASVFPYNGLPALARLYFMRLIGRPSALDKAIQRFLEAARLLLRKALTELMMTLALPCGEPLRLADDLKGGFSPLLQHITNPELNALLDKLDPTPDSLAGSGARDWADLPDRLHFIIDLFRSYQENQDLLDPPFTSHQTEVLKKGELPEGRL
jgi:hypothetical protein